MTENSTRSGTKKGSKAKLVPVQVLKHEVVWLPLEKLIPYENNAKTHPKEQIAKLKKMLAKGPDQPIVVDQDLVIIKGHGRRQAAMELGLKEFPVVVRGDLTPDEVKAHRLGDNQNAISDIDMALAKIDLDDLLSKGFDMDLTGFSDWSLTEGSAEPQCDEDEVPEQASAVAQRGQVWKLGRHRLMCGDSTSGDDVTRLFDGNNADITFSSPPYNASKNGHLNGRVSGFENKYQKHDDAMEDDDYLSLLTTSTLNALAHCKYAFINLQLLSHNRTVLMDYQSQMKSKLKDILIWNKSQCPPNIVKGAFNTKWEYVFCFSDDVKTRGFPCEWQGQFPNVVETASNSSNEHADAHRAGFPVAFPLWFLEKLDFAKSVYDCFGGTGTTMIAAESAGRICYMMELDEHYCDVIIARWEKYTGQKAGLEGA